MAKAEAIAEAMTSGTARVIYPEPILYCETKRDLQTVYVKKGICPNGLELTGSDKIHDYSFRLMRKCDVFPEENVSSISSLRRHCTG